MTEDKLRIESSLLRRIEELKEAIYMIKKKGSYINSTMAMELGVKDWGAVFVGCCPLKHKEEELNNAILKACSNELKRLEEEFANL